jgi:hypothetical protein
MEIMFRFALLAVLGLAAFAQTGAAPAEKPPADVDQALRARVSEFYTLVVNHEYRKAEALIADDTKDYYYEGTKPEVTRFEVVDVQYSDHFTNAKVFTQCGQRIAAPGFPPSEFTMKFPTTWRFENGNWFLYVDQSKLLSPVGLPLRPPLGSVPAPPAGLPTVIPQDPSFVFGKVSADKEMVQLAAGSTVQVHITNGLQGPMSLELGAPLKGIEAKLDRTNLANGEKAVLSLTAGKEPTSGPFYLRVVPTGEAILIRVQVK